MSYPEDPDRVRFDKGHTSPADLPYGGYPQQQYLDPYTGQPMNDVGSPASSYSEQPYGVPSYSDQGYQQYPDQGYQQYPAQAYDGYPSAPYGQGFPPPPGTNGMAIGALVASLVGIITCGLGSIVGAILGHVALNQIKKTGQEGHGMALAGVIVGWIFFGLWVLYWIVVVGVAVASSP